ncbi:MAG: prepilin peptidase [Candidatus Saccharimonadia bacterium]
MVIIETSFFSIIGLIIGSFINAVVWRVHEKRTIGNDRSICPNCHHVLAPIDLIPVLSWILLKARCRYCRKPISWQYPLVELLTAILFGYSYFVFQPSGLLSSVQFLIWLYVLASLLILSVYDLRWMILPNIIIFPALVVTFIGLLFDFGVSHSTHALLFPILAALTVGAVFAAFALVANGKLMGFGDVKLVILMGLFLGFQKLGLALFVGFDSAAIIGLALLATRLRKRTDHIPFGPFLAAGTIVAALFGTQLINWYLRLIGA